MRKFLSATGIVLILLGSSTFASAAPHDPKVTICHATSSASNPYVQITVDADAVNGSGHGQDHSGHSGDIIPPVAGVTAGQNWDATGQAIFANGCQPATPPTTTPPTVPPTVPDPPVVDPVPPVVVDPPTAQPPAVEEPPVLIPPATVAPPVVTEPAVTERSPELPRTGAGTAWLAAIGAGLCALGAGLQMVSRRFA